jgi:hypothetical protein
MEIFLTAHKELIASIQSLATIIAMIIAGTWALRRLSFERPFQSALCIEISALTLPIISGLNLFHIEIIVKNIGRSVVTYGDTDNANIKSWVKVAGIKKDAFGREAAFAKGMGTHKFVSWDDNGFVVDLYDGPFISLFSEWFENTTSVTLEAGEWEQYSIDLMLQPTIENVSISVKVYESTTRDRKLGRPYYWLAQKIFPCALQCSTQYDT